MVSQTWDVAEQLGMISHTATPHHVHAQMSSLISSSFSYTTCTPYRYNKMRIYEFGHLCRPNILKPVLYVKTQGPIRFRSLDSKPKQQLRQPLQPPKPYISSKYTRKPQVSSKKGTDHQTEDRSYGVNGERILHHPWLIYPGDSNAMKLPDGRWLGFAMFGRADPKREMIPLVAFHGTPGTRLNIHGDHNWSYRNFTPVIAPERNGMGLSTYVTGHSVADHARDVLLLVSDTKKSWNIVC
jgi:hypothetical protein